MNINYPTLEQIPIRGRLERMGGAAGLLERLGFSGAVGVLKVGVLELHIHGSDLTHAVHDGLEGEAAALAILQIERGGYQFFAQDPIRTLSLEVSATTLKAMQLTDESQSKPSKPSLLVLPNIKAALEYIRGVGGLNGWKARLTSIKNSTAVLLEKGGWQIVAMGATWDELQLALQSSQQGLNPMFS